MEILKIAKRLEAAVLRMTMNAATEPLDASKLGRELRKALDDGNEL